MDLPGAGGARTDAEAWAHAEKEQEHLLEELKESVKTEVKDIGVLRKELHVTVPEKTIADHLEQNYSELMQDAQVPGFRKGRAPRRLIEKRFGAEVRESLTTSIVGQSYFAATDKEKLDVLGDPRFRLETEQGVTLVEFDEAMQHLKLPETGDFAYTCEVELKPAFELPELEGIEIRAPQVEVTDEMVDEQMLRHRKNRGRFELIDEAAQKDDQLVAAVALTVEGELVKREENVTLGVRPTRVEGIPLISLDEELAGANPGETRKVSCKIPPDFERADLRGKAGEFAFTIHEIKRLAPEPMESFLQAYGFEDEGEAREQFRSELEAERGVLMERAKRAQVERYLLDNTDVDLPADFSARQTDRAVVRRVVELQQRGVPWSDIEAGIDELRTSAKEQVAEELKLSFVLEKVSDQLGVHVTDEEVNTEIARIAQMYNRRFDRVRDDLRGRGLLEQLVEQIRHNKCISLLLADAKIAEEPADKKKTPKKTGKRTTEKKPKSTTEKKAK